MSIGRKQRWIVLIILLGLTLSAAAWVNQDDAVAEPELDTYNVTRQSVMPRDRVKIEKDSGLKLNKLKRMQKDTEAADLFTSKTWYVPPPQPKQPKQPLLPPPPTAPMLPFVYMGKLIEDGQLTVYLNKLGHNYVVKLGDTIDDMYKVELVTPRMMTLVYLPLNIKQTLMIGGE